ncbi:MAG: cupin domain-containing protein [Planctomycetota bacterium]
MQRAINIDEKLAAFDAQWTPHIIAELNGQLVKLAKLEGAFTWHDHAGEDELFFVISGRLRMQIRTSDGNVEEIEIRPGELYVVPRGVEHNPIADPGTAVMLFEPAETRHTGAIETDRTVNDQTRI